MTAPAPVPDGTNPPAEAVEAAYRIDIEHRPASVSVERDSVTCACGHETTERLGLAAHRAEFVTAAVVAALDLPERDRETAAKAWGEGHTTRWRRDPDDGCTCGAWASIECGCGRYGSGELLSLNDNPYAASALRERRADGSL